MILDIFRAGSGDCILITSDDETTRILADAGVPEAYKQFIAAPLSVLRGRNKAIDVVYVSHIDQDHIGGVLGMLDTEVAWVVHEHMTGQGKKWKLPAVPRPPEIKAIWHNAFLETIADSAKVKIDSAALGAALGQDAAAMALAHALGMGPAALAAAEEYRMLALSVGQAIAVNWRIGPDQLNIPLNPPFNGKLMIWKKSAAAIQVGPIEALVLGPTPQNLKDLRDKDWAAYLRSKSGKNAIASTKKKHAKDIGDLTSATPIEIVLGGNQTVTPPNVASLVLLLRENGRSVLMTGDADDAEMLPQFDKAGLLKAGILEVDVLKVPHHGAHNSYSDDFAKTVRAGHYIFCCDGEHGNPEIDVVEGYIAAVKAAVKSAPLPGGQKILFWFNCSAQLLAADGNVEKEKLDHWKEIEKLFKSSTAPFKANFLTKGPSLRLKL